MRGLPVRSAGRSWIGFVFEKDEAGSGGFSFAVLFDCRLKVCGKAGVTAECRSKSVEAMAREKQCRNPM
jgi:hypothetical protein